MLYSFFRITSTSLQTTSSIFVQNSFRFSNRNLDSFRKISMKILAQCPELEFCLHQNKKKYIKFPVDQQKSFFFSLFYYLKQENLKLVVGMKHLFGTGSGVSLVPGLGCSPKKLFSCQLCGKVLCSKASLKRHIADKHAERQEEYRCIICERVYCSRNSLMTHIYTYHKSRPGELDIKDIKFF